MFQAGAEVRTSVTDSTVREMLTQMRRLRTDTLTSAELARAEAEVAGSYPLTCSP
jgi:hypothetical protein